MPSGLLNDPSLNRGWNLRWLVEVLQDYELNSPDTYFKNVSHLLPDEIVRFTESKTQKHIY